LHLEKKILIITIYKQLQHVTTWGRLMWQLPGMKITITCLQWILKCLKRTQACIDHQEMLNKITKDYYKMNQILQIKDFQLKLKRFSNNQWILRFTVKVVIIKSQELTLSPKCYQMICALLVAISFLTGTTTIQTFMAPFYSIDALRSLYWARRSNRNLRLAVGTIRSSYFGSSWSHSWLSQL